MDSMIPIGSKLFSPEQLQKAIAETATLAGDKKGAIIGSYDASGAHVALVVKISDHVEVQGAVDWSPAGTVSGGAKVIASW